MLKYTTFKIWGV